MPYRPAAFFSTGFGRPYPCRARTRRIAIISAFHIAAAVLFAVVVLYRMKIYPAIKNPNFTKFILEKRGRMVYDNFDSL